MARLAAWGPCGLFGWRHLLAAFVTLVIRRIGSDRDVEEFRADPIRFFCSIAPTGNTFVLWGPVTRQRNQLAAGAVSQFDECSRFL